MKTKQLFTATLLAIVSLMATAQNSGQNYMRNRTMLNATGSQYIDNVSYYDGLGRPWQQLVKQTGGTTQVDNLLRMQTYDVNGRMDKEYLTIADGTTLYLAPSNFVSKANSQHSDNRPYMETIYENSPLNRVLKQVNPGLADVISPLQTAYMSNTTSGTLCCVRYVVDSNGNLSSNGNYSAGTLSVVQTTDEVGNVSYTFTDTWGNVVLQRAINTGDVPHDTYYVYDSYGNLAWVLPPMVNNNLITSTLNNYAYHYKYDSRNRLIEKKLPGAEKVTYIYDNADHLTYSQDGAQRAKGVHTIYLYDQLNRLVLQGEITSNSKPDVSDRTINAVPVWKESDGLTFIASEFPGTGYRCNLNDVFGITPAYPKFYLRNYYDTYDMEKKYGFKTISPMRLMGDDPMASGMLTGSIYTNPDDTLQKCHTLYYYNEKGLLKERRSSTPQGYGEFESYTYTFTGQPMRRNYTLYQSASMINTLLGRILLVNEYRSYSYDSMDRLKEITMGVAGVDTITLLTNSYDELGRIEKRSYHGATATSTNLVQNYIYDLRNRPVTLSSSSFTQTLGRAKNGNISLMNSTLNGESHNYTYTYDKLGRMLDAIHSNNNRYTEKVTEYDKNGNILKLERYGKTGTNSYGKIDNLTYFLSGNQLLKVDDLSGNTAGFNNGANSLDEFAYDANGSMTKDLNKGISNIQYNSLSLPTQVVFDNGSTMSYRYTADGVKWRTIYTSGSTSVTTDYVGNVVLQNGAVKLLRTEGGYVSFPDKVFHYHITDHQGNVRLVVNGNGIVEEANHYYPFGSLAYSSNNVQPYKYNGKEWDDKTKWYDYGARHYDATLGRFTTMDPLGEVNYSSGSYTYCLNNPIKYIDPTGCLESTHTDSIGNVVEVYNDGDLSVYRHDSDEEGTRKELEEKYSRDNTSGGGEWMGETEYWDEFLDSNGKIPKGMRIEYGLTFDSDFADYAAKASTMNIIKLAMESTGRGSLNVKNRYGNIGRMFRGKFITSRSLGNYLAGYNASNAMISFEAFQKIAGALHIEENYGKKSLTPFDMATIVLLGTYNSSKPMMFKAPLWGEEYYQFRMSRKGWNHGNK